MLVERTIKARAEVLAALSLVLGWLLLTSAIAEFAPRRFVWLVSGGLFSLSCFGWGPLFVLARFGLYHATRDEKAKRGVNA